ncbi:MAG: hypothetical protein ACLUGG_12480 [Oscillospiraceae bacterium]|jgi:predicted PurR-regulated permease PerM|nr:hypothetical protein [Christensenellales bacterium]
MEQPISTPAQDPMLEQQKLLKAMYRMSIIRTVACLLIFLVIAGSALYVLPGVKRLVDQLSIVADNLEQIDVTYMTESVTNLAVTGTESLETAMRQVTAALENLNKLDIDTLNQSIADLGAIVEPMARLFGTR